MNKREMANQLRKWSGQGITYTLGREVLMSGEIAAAAAEALEREAEREEQDRPVYSLKEQIADIDDEFSGTDTAGNAAAATLRKLDEEGGKLLARHANTTFACCCDGCVLAHSLGVEPKP